MNLTIKFHRLAEQDLMAASRWYESKRDDLGLEFLDEIERCIALAAQNPQQFPILDDKIRSLNTRRFPYRIYFQHEDNRIVVLAIFHNRRDPVALSTRID